MVNNSSPNPIDTEKMLAYVEKVGHLGHYPLSIHKVVNAIVVMSGMEKGEIERGLRKLAMMGKIKMDWLCQNVEGVLE